MIDKTGKTMGPLIKQVFYHLSRVVNGDQRLGTSLVIAVLAGNLCVKLSLFLHKHFVNAPINYNFIQ